MYTLGRGSSLRDNIERGIITIVDLIDYRFAGRTYIDKVRRAAAEGVRVNERIEADTFRLRFSLI